MFHGPPSKNARTGGRHHHHHHPGFACIPAAGQKYYFQCIHSFRHQPSQSYQLQIHTGLATANATPAARTTLVHQTWACSLPGTSDFTWLCQMFSQIKSINQRETRKKTEGDPPRTVAVVQVLQVHNISFGHIGCAVTDNTPHTYST